AVMRIVVGGLCAVVLAWVASLQTVAAGGSSADLAALALSNGKITRAETVDGGTPPGQRSPSKPLPAFCRVAATLTPSSDSARPAWRTGTAVPRAARPR